MKQPTIAALAATLSFLPAAQAELHDRGNGLIYDDVLDITWLQDANLFKTLCDAGDPLATDFDPPQWGDDASLCGYKGLAFYADSGNPIELPGTCEVVRAKKIWIPG